VILRHEKETTMISVLHVDDDPSFLDLCTLFLEETGEFTLDTATSARKAIEKLESGSYDAIVSDYLMPGMDGIELLKYVRSRYGSIPFIIFTGRGREDVVIEALNNGADFYLQKGGDREQFVELAHMIRQAVQRRETERESERRTENLRAVSELAVELAAAPSSGNPFRLIADTLREIAGAFAAGISTYDPDRGELKIEYISVSSDAREALQKASSLIGRELVGMRLPVSPATREHMRTEIVSFSSDLAEVLLGAVPEPITAHIQQLFGLGIFAGLSLNYGGEVQGSAVIIMPEGQPPPPTDVLLTFAHVAGVSLQRIRAEEALRQSEAEKSTILESQVEIMVFQDPDMHIRWANRAAGAFLGTEPESLVGTRCYTLWHRRTTPCEGCPVVRVLQTGEPHRNEITSHDGRCWIISAAPVRDEHGHVMGALESALDVTDLKQAEQALTLANKKLNLLSSVTRHDILNQLNVLLLYLEIAKKETTDQTLLGYLEKQEAAARAVLRQIAFTSDYQDLGASAPEWQTVSDIIRESVPHQLAVINDLEGLEIFADPLLRKVFYNLADNTIRHGETVTTVRAYFRESDEGITLFWEDDGVGIPYSRKEAIFQRDPVKTTGGGLFLIRDILSITGITIAETGEPGKGARFEIRVPSSASRIRRKTIPP